MLFTAVFMAALFFAEKCRVVAYSFVHQFIWFGIEALRDLLPLIDPVLASGKKEEFTAFRGTSCTNIDHLASRINPFRSHKAAKPVPTLSSKQRRHWGISSREKEHMPARLLAFVAASFLAWDWRCLRVYSAFWILPLSFAFMWQSSGHKKQTGCNRLF